ncbi:ABC transporter permease [Desulfotomaculum copahuensis]|uniref:Transport permease protein n=1 Tax=Desulfotomaculum copahuensis TaxID=1838280 RepID=A0A1B7LCT0_9FIRM|nr:ABC transporter permease [Desulfotomaculum copahuensis]OAT80720.1 multidrug ABC transporter permease [Desulfotomaculum copahuensis]
MNSGRCAVPAGVSVEGPASAAGGVIQRTLTDVLAIAEMEVRKLRHDPTELLTRAVQPVLWLLIFGQAFSRVRAFDTGGVAYQAFMTPGILSQSVMFIAIFFGISIIWEKDMGVLQKFLAMPIPRVALVLGKALAAGVRALSQAAIVFLLAALIGVPLRWHPVDLLSAAGVAILGAVTFATLSMIIAALVKTRERFMGIGQLLTMPLFFASNALYPVSIMPDWLRVVAAVNPLSYMVDFLRGALVTGQLANWPLDVGVLLAACVAFTIIATYLYPQVVA